VINGGRTWNGSVAIGGAKNATLALMPHNPRRGDFRF
jgi:UDP-N-acetylglucosamine enolpyruvyl transferase